jgi:hypothetical protein
MTSNYHTERREIRTGGQRELEGAAVVLDPSRIQPGTNSLPNRCGGHRHDNRRRQTVPAPSIKRSFVPTARSRTVLNSTGTLILWIACRRCRFPRTSGGICN